MSTNKAAPQKQRMVQDSKGSVYELTSELSSGGQGVVYRTQYPQALIKGFTNKDEQARRRWREHIEWLTRQDLADLKLARPLELLAEPRCGYVMELMDGLVPLQGLLDSFANAEEEAHEDYLRQGGLRRRIRILGQMARTLNQLHGRGMLYGDLSPNNIFVSDDPAFAETWLIDCDNISLDSHSGLTLHTVDYGAPEVVRGEALLSSLTDCWSFAVIAYQLLTHNHPFKGEMISDGEPEVEDAALSGEHPGSTIARTTVTLASLICRCSCWSTASCPNCLAVASRLDEPAPMNARLWPSGLRRWLKWTSVSIAALAAAVPACCQWICGLRTKRCVFSVRRQLTAVWFCLRSSLPCLPSRTGMG